VKSNPEQFPSGSSEGEEEDMKRAIKAIGVVGILAAVVFSPEVSTAIDCSYGGTFVPPLPSLGGQCVASGVVRSKGIVEIPLGSPMQVVDLVTLKLQKSSGSPGSLIIDPNGILTAGVDSESTGTIMLDAVGDIISNGFLILTPEEYNVILRTSTGNISLVGTGTTGKTMLVGQGVKLESSKGNIILDHVTIFAEYSSDVFAPKGTITISNSTFTVLGEGGEGECRFNPGGAVIGINDPSFHNTFDCKKIVVNK
jgi:hypothetical protein